MTRKRTINSNLRIGQHRRAKRQKKNREKKKKQYTGNGRKWRRARKFHSAAVAAIFFRSLSIAPLRFFLPHSHLLFSFVSEKWCDALWAPAPTGNIYHRFLPLFLAFRHLPLLHPCVYTSSVYTGKFKSTNSVQQFHCNEKNRRRGSAMRQIRRRLNIKWDMTGALFLFRFYVRTSIHACVHAWTKKLCFFPSPPLSISP